MDKFAIILLTVGVAILIFSLWSLIIIYRHIRSFRKSHLFSSAITDQKYFELKTRQEFIVAVGAIIVSLVAFIGFDSIDDIKINAQNEI